MSKQSKPGDGQHGKGIRRSRHPEFNSLFETQSSSGQVQHKDDDKPDDDPVNPTHEAEA